MTGLKNNDDVKNQESERPHAAHKMGKNRPSKNGE
jgi:hypothetical protein